MALGPNGAIFVGSRRSEGGFIRWEILRIVRDGMVSVFATLDPAVSPGAPGLLNLALDPAGVVYAALASFNPSTHGVWQVNRDGTAIVRLPGSEGIPFPNALVFGPNDNLYITDSTGAIWRVGRDGVAHEWVRHALLLQRIRTTPSCRRLVRTGLPSRRRKRCMSQIPNRGLIARITLGADGSPGPLQVVAEGFSLLTIDGIAMDVRGEIHGVVAGFALLGTDPLVRVEPSTGTIRSTPTIAAAFDVPLSIAFGAGPWDHSTVFVTNGALPIGVPGPGPGVVQAEVGVPGFIGR